MKNKDKLKLQNTYNYLTRRSRRKMSKKILKKNLLDINGEIPFEIKFKQKKMKIKYFGK